MGQPEAGQDIGTGALAQANHVLYVKVVQHSNQVLAQGLERGKWEAIGQGIGIVRMSRYIHVNETGALLYLRHAGAAHELLEGIICDQALLVICRAGN